MNIQHPEHKRVAQLILCCALVIVWMMLSMTFSVPVAAQGGFKTPTPDVVRTAQQLISEAEANSSSAQNIVLNANGSVTTAVQLLNIALAASAVAVVLVLLIFFLTVRATITTLGNARRDLNKARKEISSMRSELVRETDDVRTRSQQASQALSLTQLGEQQLSTRNIKGALKLYERAYTLDSTNPATSYFLGELYIQDKQLDKGIEYLKKALTLGTNFAPAEAALGYALRLLADTEEDITKQDMIYAQAEERLLRALQMDSSVLDIHGESIYGKLGGLYKRQDRIEKAIACYEEARKITPQQSYPLNNLGLLYYGQNNTEQWQRHFQSTVVIASRSLESNPADFWPRLDRLVAEVALGQTEQAIEDMETITAQIKSEMPLENTLTDLLRLKESSHPPQGIDDLIDVLRFAIQRVKNQVPMRITA